MKNSQPLCETNLINEKAVKEVSSKMLDERTVLKTSEIFKILSDPTRIKILFALAKHELCVCDLSALLGTTQSAISHQLRLLRNAHLVKFRKEGKVVYYSLADKHVINLIQNATKHASE